MSDPHGDRILEELDKHSAAQDINQAFGTYLAYQLRELDAETAKAKRVAITRLMLE